jgi:hypothetical protein
MSTCHDPAPVRIHQPGSLIFSPFDRHSRILDNNTSFRHYCIHLDLRYFHQVYTTISHPFISRAIRPCIVVFVILGHRFVQTCTCSLVRISTNIHYLISLMRRFGSIEPEGTLNCSDYADAGCSWSFRPINTDILTNGYQVAERTLNLSYSTLAARRRN